MEEAHAKQRTTSIDSKIQKVLQDKKDQKAAKKAKASAPKVLTIPHIRVWIHCRLLCLCASDSQYILSIRLLTPDCCCSLIDRGLPF